MKLFILDILIVLRLLTNDGIMLENRRPIPKKQPPEIQRCTRRKGKIKRKGEQIISSQSFSAEKTNP